MPTLNVANLSRHRLPFFAPFFTLFFLVSCGSTQNQGQIILKSSSRSIPVQIELARTPQEKERGLMYRKTLPEGQGMLFVYDKPSLLSFWMKNTLIPLDILFIGSDQKIKTISENTPPCSPGTACPSYVSTEPVQYVLEVSGGTVARQKIGVGDSVEVTNALK